MLPPTPARVWPTVAQLDADLSAQEWAQRPVTQQMLRDAIATLAALGLALTGSVNGIGFDGKSDIAVASAAGSLTGPTLAPNVLYSMLRWFGPSPQLAAPFVTGALTLDPTTPQIAGSAAGNVLLTDSTGATFFLLRLGGSTNAFPALQRNGTGLTASLADGSGRTRFDAKTLVAVGGAIYETAPVLVTYSASMTFDATTGNTFIIAAGNATAFTINAPTSPASGQRIAVKIKNVSGGALGVITWNAIFKMAAFTAPANGFSRTVRFTYDGTNWVEERNDVDVAN